MNGKVLTEEFANKVYDILVKYGKAQESERAAFIYAHTNLVNKCWEWRFCGAFGFGGKYWSESNHVNYYNEDRTKKRDNLQKKINKLLLEIK